MGNVLGKKQNNNLPPEIWSIIINHCKDSDQKWEFYDRISMDEKDEKSLKRWKDDNRIWTCMQICKTSRKIALPLLFEKVCFNDLMDLKESRKFIEHIQQNQEKPEKVLNIYFDHVKEIEFKQSITDSNWIKDWPPKNFNAYNFFILLKNCKDLRKLIWQSNLFNLPKQFAQVITSHQSLQEIKLYDDNVQGTMFSYLPLGWKDLCLFTAPRYFDLEGYLTENEFDWTFNEKMKNSKQIQNVLSLMSVRGSFGVSITQKYREVRRTKRLYKRAHQYGHNPNSGLVGSLGMAYWLFENILDNLSFVYQKQKIITKSKVELKNENIFDFNFTNKWNCLLRIGLSTSDAILLRTSIPIWIFGVEPYFSENEERYDYWKILLEKEEIKEMKKRQKLFENRSNAFCMIRSELLKSTYFQKSTLDCLKEEDDDKVMRILIEEINQISKSLLKSIPSNKTLEKKVFQQKQLVELENDLYQMTSEDHVRQIAFNLISDLNLRTSLARIFLTLYDVCLIQENNQTFFEISKPM